MNGGGGGQFGLGSSKPPPCRLSVPAIHISTRAARAIWSECDGVFEQESSELGLPHSVRLMRPRSHEVAKPSPDGRQAKLGAPGYAWPGAFLFAVGPAIRIRDRLTAAASRERASLSNSSATSTSASTTRRLSMSRATERQVEARSLSSSAVMISGPFGNP